MKPRVSLSAQLHSSSGRSSKIIKDHTPIETVVEMTGVGRLVLDVDSRGGYSLRAYSEGSEDPSRDLLAVGVVRAEGATFHFTVDANGEPTAEVDTFTL